MSVVAGRFDLEPNELQRELLESFGAFFAREVTPDVVRGAERSGIDRSLWDHLVQLGVLDMVVRGAAASDSGRWELTLVARLVGETLAPVPFVEMAVVTRTLAAAGAQGADHGVSSLVPDPIDGAGSQVVPWGAVADALLARRGDALVLVEPTTRLAAPAGVNLSASPVGVFRWPCGDAVETIVEEGEGAHDAWRELHMDWRLGLAAMLAGAAARALEIATEQARSRHQFGAPIGSFQGVSHRLADVATHTDAARLVVDKATWAADRGAPEAASLVEMAWCQATRAAEEAASAAVHVLGGYGITEEYDAQLYFRRVKGWALLGGGRTAGLARLADHVLG